MDKAIIARVQGFGFSVYMRDPADTWMIFTDGKNLGYLQTERLGGYTLCTVHEPNTTIGTGFQIERHIDAFDRATLERAFVFAPEWAGGREREAVAKYRDIEDYRRRDSWSAAYALVDLPPAGETG